MAKKAQDIIDHITMINNINNVKNINDINNTIFVSEESNEVEALTSSSVLASASQEPLEEALASHGTLPSKWKGVKLDLFKHPKLKITIIRHDNSKFACYASLNSPRSYVFRGRDQNLGSERHWQLIEYLMDLRKNEDYAISKVGQARKAGTIDDFAALIYHRDGVWHTDLIFELRIWSFKLTGSCSESFLAKDGIATAFIGTMHTGRSWITAEELGI